MKVSNKEEAQAYFVSIIQDYIDALGDLSRRNQKTIALSSGVSQPNLSRIMNESKVPKPQEIYDICKVIGSSSESRDLISKIYPGQTHLVVDDVFGTNVKENEYIKNEHESFFENKRYFGILARSYTAIGVSVNKIIADYGKDGSNRIVELQNAGLIKEENGFLFGLKKNCQLAMSATKKMIKLSVNFHKTFNMGTSSNQAFFMTFCVNKNERMWIYSFIRVSRQIIREAISKKKISETLKNEILELLNIDLVKDRLIEKECDLKEKEHVFLSTVFDDFNLPQEELKKRVIQ